MSKLVIACSLENCVHVGGVMNFLRLAEDKGFRTHFLGPAVPVENSMLFARELCEKNIPFELHIYPEGPHGLSLATEETDNGNIGTYPHVATWVDLCQKWLENVFK